MDLSKYRLKDTEEILSLFRQDKEGFHKFYKEVEMLLNTLRIGDSIYIPDVCEEDSYIYFVKCVEFYMCEETKYLQGNDARIELSIDYSRIMRCLTYS
ncbi:hypothetical protein EZS27_004058 [termite gut metagenome]|uniref:Uncharacterized protein n=1 Tax=termite gut metagenome TaxID=433724 RepID=A0A5J4SRA8_9ZZZZ